MNDDIAFRELIVLAQEGNMEALNKLIDMYMPLVNKHSNINGRINEDLRQLAKDVFEERKGHQNCHSAKDEIEYLEGIASKVYHIHHDDPIPEDLQVVC